VIGARLRMESHVRPRKPSPYLPKSRKTVPGILRVRRLHPPTLHHAINDGAPPMSLALLSNCLLGPVRVSPLHIDPTVQLFQPRQSSRSWASTPPQPQRSSWHGTCRTCRWIVVYGTDLCAFARTQFHHDFRFPLQCSPMTTCLAGNMRLSFPPYPMQRFVAIASEPNPSILPSILPPPYGNPLHHIAAVDNCIGFLHSAVIRGRGDLLWPYANRHRPLRMDAMSAFRHHHWGRSAERSPRVNSAESLSRAFSRRSCRLEVPHRLSGAFPVSSWTRAVREHGRFGGDHLCSRAVSRTALIECLTDKWRKSRES
jgi:hypothetical protein